jgi:peptide/nickel transport system ATP-binding protein
VDFDFHEGERGVHRGGKRQGNKTTLSKCFGLLSVTEGEDQLPGQAAGHRKPAQETRVLEKHSGIFQDPFSSFNVFNTDRHGAVGLHPHERAAGTCPKRKRSK